MYCADACLSPKGILSGAVCGANCLIVCCFSVLVGILL